VVRLRAPEGQLRWTIRPRVTGGYDEHDESEQQRPEGAAPLRVVSGPMRPPEGDLGPPAVRLRREFKGLTVADMYREEIVARLPGQARSALRHIERGELAAAERALPGHFATVLEGPGGRRRRRARWGWLAVAGAAGAVCGWLLWSWLTAP